ncbi:MAG: prepilin-type N-terminal cleavage/methylation domain-containing protein [Alteromonadaceae bacterium]|nr:prepilin-type N-terminal cleavage/methylation domain-containing protein [Alteromonadaceae bacterium]
MIKKLKLKQNSNYKHHAFTLIELMVVMAIVAILMTMVGPLAINTLDKAQAKQEMLTMKNWFRKISYRAFATGQTYQLKLTGKKAELFLINSDPQAKKAKLILSKSLESLFFQPQTLTYSAKGFVSPLSVTGTYRHKALTIDLNSWVNGEKTVPKERLN